MSGRTMEFDGVVRLTRMAVGYLIFTLVVGFSAINTGNNSLYIALSFMLAGLIISGMASKGGLKKIELEIGGIDEASVGQTAYGVVKAVNRSRIWNVRDVVVFADGLERPLFLPLLRRGETVRIEARFVFPRRGKIRFHTARLYTRYPFGLFLKKRQLKLSGEIIVFPRLFARSAHLDTIEVLRGDKARADRLGPGSDIRSFRDYVRGDSLRQVHWKRSASVGRWIMKETELEANQSVEIAVDSVLPPDATEDQFEEMISQAATLVRDAIDAQLEVALHTPGGSVRGGGDGARRPMFEVLALLEPSGEGWAEWNDPHTVVFSLRRGSEKRSA
jgi:uncharacterized protein (DUF58 family)